MLEPLEVARQLTLLIANLFLALKPSELYNKNWSSNQRLTLSPNVCKIIDYFNKVLFSPPPPLYLLSLLFSSLLSLLFSSLQQDSFLPFTYFSLSFLLPSPVSTKLPSSLTSPPSI